MRNSSYDRKMTDGGAQTRRRKPRAVLPAAFSAAIWLLFVCLLTGCAKKPEGGTLTRQGMEALEHSDYQTALADFNQAITNGEDMIPALRGLGMTQLALARYEEAAQTFEKALDLTDDRMPGTVRDITLYEVNALFRAGRYADAVPVCTRLLEEKRTLEPVYYLGACYLAMDDEEQAKEYFDEAVSLAPRDYALYLQIYELYEDRNLTAIGDEYLQKALQNQPESTQDYYHIGQIRYYLEKYDEARNALAGPVEEKYLPAMELMGEIYLAQEDYDHAFAIYRSIMEESGESPGIYNGLAMCAIASGDPDAALSYISEGLALEEEEGKQKLRFNEIVAYERKLDFSTALVKAEAYSALYPTDEAGQKELKFLRTRSMAG